MSDDGLNGLTVIAFVGSVFSPYYAWRRQRGTAEPEDFCAVNAALYGARGKRWAMTERGRSRLDRSAGHFSVGPSALRWDGDSLTIDLDEVAVPCPARIRGRVRVWPSALTPAPYTLDANRRHRWWPIAPLTRVEVELSHPRTAWSGTGYLDSNAGDEPLEDGFREWDWSRAALPEGAAVVYDVTRADRSEDSLVLRFDASGGVEHMTAPPRIRLPRTAWGISRATRADAGETPSVAKTFEDTPFYARSLLDTRLFGHSVPAVHESLSLTRFRRPWVRALLPFRMPRRPG